MALDSNQKIKDALDYSDIHYGAKTAIGATALQMNATSTELAVGVHVKALSTNAGIVYVGGNDDVTTALGYPLSAGQEVFIQVNNIDQVWVIASAVDQAVRYIAS